MAWGTTRGWRCHGIPRVFLEVPRRRIASPRPLSRASLPAALQRSPRMAETAVHTLFAEPELRARVDELAQAIAAALPQRFTLAQRPCAPAAPA